VKLAVQVETEILPGEAAALVEILEVKLDDKEETVVALESVMMGVHDAQSRVG